MKKLVMLFLTTVFVFAQSEFSDPQPTFDEPRKVVFQLFDSDLKRVSHTIGSMYNILKEYPQESLKIVVVTYGNGMRALKKDYDERTLTRISSLMEYDVEFIGCRNTMETMNWKDEEFIDGVDFVQAGIVEFIERQTAGFAPVLAF